MSPGGQTLRPRRDGSGSSLLSAPQVEVHDQQQLLALPAGTLPVLRGHATFALGAGAVAHACDEVRVCVLEGAGVLARDRATLHVWEGGAIAGSGQIDVTVGQGGRAWVVSEQARIRCQPGPSGQIVDEDQADLEAHLHGRSDAWVEGGCLTAGGGAVVSASGRATLILDRTVESRHVDGRSVTTRLGPELPPPDPAAELARHLGLAPRRTPHPDRSVLLPWISPSEAPTALLEPVLDVLVAAGARRSGPWRREAGIWTADVRGRRPDWPAVLARLALPPTVACWDGPDGQRVRTDLDVQIRLFTGGLLSRF